MTTAASPAARSIRYGRIIGLVALGGGVALLVALPFPVLLSPPLRFVLLSTALIGGTIGWIVEIRAPRLNPVLLAGLALTVIAATLSAWASPHPSTAFSGALATSAYAGIAIGSWRWLQAPEARRNTAVVVGVGGLLLVAGSYLVGVVGAWSRWIEIGLDPSLVPMRPGGIQSWVSGPMWTSDYVALFAPIAVAAAWVLLARGRLAAVVGLCVLALAVILIAAIRSVWLAGAVVLTVLVAWAVWRRRAALRARPRLLVALIGASTVAVALAVVAGTPRAGHLLRDADEGRTSAWSAALTLYRDNVLVGAGPGSFATLRIGFPADTAGEQNLLDPHNGILATASQTGTLGLIALVLTIGSVAVISIQGIRSSRDTIALGAAAALAIVGLHRMVDIVFMLPGMMIASILAAGLAMGPASRAVPGRWARRGSLVLMAIALTLTAITIPRAAQVMRGEAAYRAAADAWAAGDTARADQLSSAVLGDLPDFVPAYQLRTMTRLRAGDVNGAISDAREAVRREPLKQSFVRLAVALVAAGADSEARNALGQATSGSPQDPVALLNGAVMADPAQRPAMLTRLLVLEPTFGAFADEIASAAGIDGHAAVIEAANTLRAGNAFASGVVLALSAGDEHLAAQLVRDMPVDQRPPLEALVAGWFGDPTAAAALEALAATDPEAADQAAYMLAVRDCREADARRWEEAIRTRTGMRPAPIADVGPTSRLKVGAQPERYPTWVWGVAEPSPPYPDAMWTIDRREGITCLPASS